MVNWFVSNTISYHGLGHQGNPWRAEPSRPHPPLSVLTRLVKFGVTAGRPTFSDEAGFPTWLSSFRDTGFNPTIKNAGWRGCHGDSARIASSPSAAILHGHRQGHRCHPYENLPGVRGRPPALEGGGHQESRHLLPLPPTT